MRKVSNSLWHLSLALTCMLPAVGCESSTHAEQEDNEPVELQIEPVVAVTRSVIEGGEQTGETGITKMQNVAVYATGDDYTTGNNHAIYTRSGGSWSNSGADKIYLTNAEATIYAYYPAYKIGTDGNMTNTATGITGGGAFSTGSTIDIATLATGAITATNNADKKYSGGSWMDNADKAIAAAPGETDYMWANSATASNQNVSKSVKLTMNHALSMISFRVYNDATYQGTGALTQIKLEDVSDAVLHSSAKMNIANGSVSEAATTATYTRDIANYTLAQNGKGNAASDGDAVGASKKLSIMILPLDSYTDKSIKASFVIDGATYSVNLSAPTGTTPSTKAGDAGFKAGSNYLYTVKLNGTELTISSVEVTPWQEVAGGDLTIN